MAKKLLTALPYVGNIAFYRLLLQYDEIWIEAHENFVKSSYRNRCEIVGPNGKQVLSIPIKGGKGIRKLYTDAQIAHEHNWLRNHWNSLQSNYRRSPYFEYYEDDFEVLFTKEYASLFDWNRDLFLKIDELLSLGLNVEYTTSFEKEVEDKDDFRYFLKPTEKVEFPSDLKYIQVFESKVGFFPNLSILDLLFNEGPNSITFLK